jgi:hypothetical protein
MSGGTKPEFGTISLGRLQCVSWDSAVTTERRKKIRIRRKDKQEEKKNKYKKKKKRRRSDMWWNWEGWLGEGGVSC